MRPLFTWIQKHEAHLSGLAMVAGFTVDSIFFVRIDERWTQGLFIGYLVTAALTIALLHYLEEYTAEGARRPKWRSILPIATQFALGGLWSGFIIFYSRSATLATSWPFLLLLGGIFLGNEILKKYHDQLVFNTTLFFFALYSYTIFALPVLTHQIGQGTFILSGVLAVALFATFLLILRHLGRFRFLKSIWQIRFGAGAVLLAMNIFYFSNILPPLPLALSHGGVYHAITKTGDGYSALTEDSPWYTSFGFSPTLHAAPNEPLYAYSAVFAPIALNTQISHEWQRYDEAAKRWVTMHAVSFSISGGRAGGYRVYSIDNDPEQGMWRVNIKSVDERLIGRLRFNVEIGVRGALTTILL